MSSSLHDEVSWPHDLPHDDLPSARRSNIAATKVAIAQVSLDYSARSPDRSWIPWTASKAARVGYDHLTHEAHARSQARLRRYYDPYYDIMTRIMTHIMTRIMTRILRHYDPYPPRTPHPAFGRTTAHENCYMDWPLFTDISPPGRPRQREVELPLARSASGRSYGQ